MRRSDPHIIGERCFRPVRSSPARHRDARGTTSWRLVRSMLGDRFARGCERETAIGPDARSSSAASVSDSATKTLATTGMRASARPGNQPCARTATPRRVGAGWKLDHLGRLKTGPPDRPGVRGAWVRLRRARTRFVGAAHGRMQWNALNATAVCSSSSAHRRFQEWTVAGVFEQFWRQGLLAYDELKGIDWTWLALDGAMG